MSDQPKLTPYAQQLIDEKIRKQETAKANVTNILVSMREEECTAEELGYRVHIRGRGCNPELFLRSSARGRCA